jgi:hypothetical protein
MLIIPEIQEVELWRITVFKASPDKKVSKTPSQPMNQT